MEREHRYTFQSLRIGLAKVVKPIVICARDGCRELGIHIVTHHDAETDRRIERSDVQSFPVHRLQLRLCVETARAVVGDLFVDARRVEYAATITWFVTLENF